MSLRELYSSEILEIENQLRWLKEGRIYELTNAKMDGSYTKIADNLQSSLDKLIKKFESDFNIEETKGDTNE